MTAIQTLWYSRSAHPSPLGLAAQLGWYLDEFRDDGLHVFTVQDSHSASVRDSHLDHSLPHSIRQGGNVPALWARARGADTRLIGLTWIDEFQGLIARGDDTVIEPRALKGRRIALPVYPGPIDARRAEALHGIVFTLQHAGIGLDDVELVDVAADRAWLPSPHQNRPHGLFGEYARQIGALLRREVDAVYVKGARGLQAAAAAQARTVLDLRQHPDPEARVHSGTPRPITVDVSLLTHHPEIVERFLARVVAVGAWAARHPLDTRAYLARETRCHETYVRQAYGDDVHRHLVTDLSPTSLQALRGHLGFLHQWGFVDRIFDIEGWVDEAPLQGALHRVAHGLLPTE